MDTIDDIVRIHRFRIEQRRRNPYTVRRGGESLAGAVPSVIESLQTNLGGTVYDTFTLGAHDPDDTITRYVA